MERFVVAIVAGGIGTVLGLWITTLFGLGTPVGILGAAVTALGAAAMLVGIASELRL